MKISSDATLFCKELLEHAEEIYKDKSFPFYKKRLNDIVWHANGNSMQVTKGQKNFLEEVVVFYNDLKILNENLGDGFRGELVSVLEKILNIVGQARNVSMSVKKYRDDVQKTLNKINCGEYLFSYYLDPVYRLIKCAKTSRGLSSEMRLDLGSLQIKINDFSKSTRVKVPKSLVNDQYPHRLFFFKGYYD